MYNVRWGVNLVYNVRWGVNLVYNVRWGVNLVYNVLIVSLIQNARKNGL